MSGGNPPLCGGCYAQRPAGGRRGLQASFALAFVRLCSASAASRLCAPPATTGVEPWGCGGPDLALCLVLLFVPRRHAPWRSGQIRRGGKSNQPGPFLANFDPTLTDLGLALAKIGPKLAKFRPTPHLAESAQILADFGQPRSPDSANMCATSGRRRHTDQSRPSWAARLATRT